VNRRISKLGLAAILAEKDMRASLIRCSKRVGQVFLIKDGSEYQVSFIDKLCKRSDTALGYSPENDINVKTFRQNKAFVPLLQKLVRPVAHLDDSTQSSAVQAGDGYVHMVDQRAPLTQNRTPAPEDIIVSMQAKAGKLQAGTAEASPVYRVVTRDGPIQLAKQIHEHVVHEIEKLESAS